MNVTYDLLIKTHEIYILNRLFKKKDLLEFICLFNIYKNINSYSLNVKFECGTTTSGYRHHHLLHGLRSHHRLGLE